MEPRIYRLSPELRRSAIYAAAGGVLIVGVAYGIGNIAIAGLSVSVAGIALALALALHWALRVDDHGVERRHWLLCTDVWSWEDFASGRIQKRHPIVFVDPERPWWRRKLGVDYLSKAECAELMGVINERYRMPEPPPVAEALHLHYGFRRSAELDWEGIRLHAGSDSRHIGWQEVERLHVARMDPVRRDFTELALTLPAERIELRMVTHQGGTTPSWRGADPEQVNEFLMAHVPADRIMIDIAGERPAHAVDVRIQIERARKRERELRLIWWGYLLSMAACLTWIALDLGILAALFLAGVAGLLAPVFWLFLREQRRQTEELTSWLADLEQSPLA